MSIVVNVNGESINYPQTGDTNWGDEATDFAIQTSAALGKIGLSSGTSVNITATLSVTGNTTLTGTLLNSDGTASLPSFSYSADTNTGIYRSASDQQDFVTGGVSRARINSTGQQSSTVPDLSGSNTTLYNEYKCRAWANFNGTLSGTISARASGNISSITKNGTGEYIVNINTAMPDGNYAVVATASGVAVDGGTYVVSVNSISAGSFKLAVCRNDSNSTIPTDRDIVSFIVIR